MTIEEKLQQLRHEIPAGCTLIAVSKTQPPEKVQEVYACGQRAFGENRAQELLAKYEVLPRDIQWHMIGHLQTNKVKDAVALFDVIHTLDRPKLAEKLAEEMKAQNRSLPCFIQVNTGREPIQGGR